MTQTLTPRQGAQAAWQSRRSAAQKPVGQAMGVGVGTPMAVPASASGAGAARDARKAASVVGAVGAAGAAGAAKTAAAKRARAQARRTTRARFMVSPLR